MDTSYTFGRWLANSPSEDEVVVTGISGRFPESNNVSEFATNLFNKRDLITDDTRRWKLEHPEVPKRNAKIYKIDKFDAGSFGIHYRQASVMDPMMRMFLECTIEAIMDAGLHPSELAGTRTSVFIGACYADMECETLIGASEPQRFEITGYLRSFIANRVSFYLQLKGASYIHDTACSSSCNALDAGYKAIRCGKCDNVIVGGVNLLQHPGITRQFFRLGVLSPDGKCKVFDQKADGYVRGETIACVLLQKAKNSRRIYAKILHSKSNDDGYKPLGITFPSTKAQEILMSEVLQESQVHASDFDYLEAHGTGTEVGDPEEVQAIDCAIAKGRTEPLLIGSVKCNIGHTEPSSGLGSLIKVIIAMESGYIPPIIHLENVKKGLEGFEQGRLVPVTETTPLENENALIGLNNFGFGGNNVHVLVRRFNKSKKNKGLPEDNLPRLVCVSGRTEEAVFAILNELNTKPLDAEYVGLLHQIYKMRSTSHLYRGFTIVAKSGVVKTDIRMYLQEHNPLYVYFGKLHNYKEVGQQLVEFPCFKRIISEINKLLGQLLKEKERENEHICGAFAVQIATVKLLKLLNVKATALYGDQTGKLAAAYYHDHITLEKTFSTFCQMVRQSKDHDLDFKKRSTPGLFYLSEGNKTLTFGDLKTSTILNVSDESISTSQELLLTRNGTATFLEVLGKLYQEGQDLQLHKLYPEIQFPVSRSTAMISPLVKWDHSKNWFTYVFGEYSTSTITQHEYVISYVFDEQRYVTGHVIDGRNLVPATEFLNSVWKTLAFSRRRTQQDLGVVFENCKFMRAVTASKTQAVKLLVSIQKGSGYFEVSEKNSVVVTGRVYALEDHEVYPITDFKTGTLDENDRTQFLEQDEIYRELYLRGYNYSGLFKGIAKCNVDATVAMIRWENNWTTFLDKMLQMKILQMDSRLLFVPTGIQKLVVNSTKHFELAVTTAETMIPIYADKNSNIIKSAAIEISGIKATSINRKKSIMEPVLEKHIFVPNNTDMTLADSARVNTQIILENSFERNFKAVEIFDDFTEPGSEFVLQHVSKALDDLPMVMLNLTISTKMTLEEEIPGVTVEDFLLTTTSNLLLFVATKIFQRPNLLNQAMNALSSNGYILTREDVDFVLDNADVDVLTEHITGNEKLILLRKERAKTEPQYIEISTYKNDWLPKLQEALKTESEVVVYSYNRDCEGLMGFVNCLRREPKGKAVYCLFIMDEAPPFNPQDQFYQDQIKKRMALNVYKDGKWGTYRHLLLEELNEVEGPHFFANIGMRGDFSSLKWFEGNLTPSSKLPKGKVLVSNYYAALNFRDIMCASGRVNLEAFTVDRREQECILGFEFAGIDMEGRRIVGMTNNAALGTLVTADRQLTWEVPDHFDLEDAATIIVVYITVLYSLLFIVKVKPGTSILIHSAAGGIGLAAINVCLYHGCEIYVTVGTPEKREFLRKTYPQIPESHIGYSRDTSFEEMIKRETGGRGVDVVLNSLSEEKLRASVRCVAVGGDFLEIGKYDMGIDASFDLLLLQRNVSFHGIMLDRIFSEAADVMSWLIGAVSEGFRRGYVKPLPKVVFEINELEKAFRYMMTGKHIGKVLIKIRNEKEQIFRGTPRFICDVEKTYIIIGGLGGFGLELADWLFLRGVRKMVLVSRSGVQTGYQTQRIGLWEAQGVTVHISTKDTTTKEGCIDLLNESSQFGPVAAVFNLAVVLKDELFENQTQEAFDTVFGPKVKATIFLDETTREMCPQLEYFVVFSSVSCGRGNPGQTNYGMANSVMERICEKRKSDGLPGLAIQWGAIGEVGLVAKMQKENKELVIGGTLQQKVSSCFKVLDKFLKQDHPVVASMVVAEKSAKSYNSDSAVDTVAFILGIKDIKAVGYNTTFIELGMDSMVGTQIIQTLETDFEMNLNPKDLRDMTFAKLIELEAEHKKDSKKGDLTDAGMNIILRNIPRGSEVFVPLVKLQSCAVDESRAPQVFILPGMESVLEQLEPVAKDLNARVLGAQYKYYNPETTIEECCETLLPSIEEAADKNSTINIVGYSFGATVGTEMVSRLEQKGYKCNFVAIEGSPEYLKAAISQHLPIDNEVEFETIILLRIMCLVLPSELVMKRKEEFLKCANLKERVALGKSLAPLGTPQKDNLEEECATVILNRFKAQLSYKFAHEKIQSPFYLFKAKLTLIEKFDEDYKFSEICKNIVSITPVDGNHHTILNQKSLAASINEIISKTC